MLPVQVPGLNTQVLDVWDQPALSSVFAVAFTVSDADRAPGTHNASATFSFTVYTVIHAGGSITLNYPTAFFEPDVTPTSASSSVQDLSFAFHPTANNSLVLTIAGDPSGPPVVLRSVVITVYGLTMGAATEGSSQGVTIQTSADIAVSLAVPSGSITGRAKFVLLEISTADRVAGNSNSTILLTFTPSAPIQTGGAITMNYPHAFFAPDITASTAASSAQDVAFSLQPTSNTSLVLTLSAAAVPASSPITITITGMTMGAATDGSPTGITVQTSADTGLSLPVHSGSIYASLVPVSVSASPLSPFAGDAVTVHGHSFMLPGSAFNCSAMIGPVPSAGLHCACSILSSSLALVQVPRDIIAAPSYVQLHFEPGNITTTAATRLCPCVRVSGGGVVCGCAANTCAARL